MQVLLKSVLISFCLFAISCNSEKNKNSEPLTTYDDHPDWEEMDWEMSPEEEQEYIAAQKNNSQWEIPKILSSSLRNLTFVQNLWLEKYLLCSEHERFLMAKLVESSDTVQNLIAVSSLDRNKERVKDSFYLYHFNINGKIISKHLIEEADYYIDEKSNFVQKENEIIFFINKSQSEIAKYSLTNKTISKSENDGEIAFNKPGLFYNEFPSKTGNKTVKLKGEGTTVLLKSKNSSWDTLITQKYSGDWSIGQVTWAGNEDKFYFDNSGAVACIWEVNLAERTIDKIVPEHIAHSPIYFSNDSTDNVIYCEGNCIKLTRAEN